MLAQSFWCLLVPILSLCDCCRLVVPSAGGIHFSVPQLEAGRDANALHIAGCFAAVAAVGAGRAVESSADELKQASEPLMENEAVRLDSTGSCLSNVGAKFWWL